MEAIELFKWKKDPRSFFLMFLCLLLLYNTFAITLHLSNTSLSLSFLNLSHLKKVFCKQLSQAYEFK